MFIRLRLSDLCFCSLLLDFCGIKTLGQTDGSGGVRLVVKEGSDVILPCYLSNKENIEAKLFDWRKDGQKEVFFYDAGIHSNNGRPGQDQQFKGRILHFQNDLKNGIASIVIRDTKVADSGDYSCDFPRLQPRQIFNIQLVVARAAAEPSVSILETDDGTLLQCEVRGASLKPTVEWQDSAGNKLPAEEPQVSERGGSFNITLQTTVKKTDRYRCVATQEEIKHQIDAKTFVFISGPAIIFMNEGSDVMLPCSLSSKETIEYKRFEWKKGDHQQVFVYDAGTHSNNGLSGQDEQFKGRVSHFQDELKNGNASIIIRNTKVADSGDYSCVFPNLQPKQIFNIQLVVVDRIFKDRSGENIPGAATKPSVNFIPTNGGMLLLCVVLGANIKVEWQDSAGNLLAEKLQDLKSGDHFSIILQTTVKKTDNYRCVATQEEIKHQIYTETYVEVNGPPIGGIVGGVVGVLIGALAVFLGIKFYRKRRSMTINVAENCEVILPCSIGTKQNIEKESFRWKKDSQVVFTCDNGNVSVQGDQFKDRVSHFPDGLKSNKASIKIIDLKVSDSGVYTCEFPNLKPKQKAKIRLVVYSSNDDYNPLLQESKT